MNGYVIGTSIGYFIPELHIVNEDEQLSLEYIFSEEYAGISFCYKF